MTIVVNLFGTPGAGKSTGASYIFSKLKMAGVNAELITEFAKDKVWESNSTALNDQIYMFAKQNHKMFRCADKVDVIITDSSLLCSLLYSKNYFYNQELSSLVLKVFNSYKNMTYLIERVKPYNPVGRYQTQQQADDLKSPILEILNKYNVKFKIKQGSLNCYDEIVDEVLRALNYLKSKDKAVIKNFQNGNELGQ